MKVVYLEFHSSALGWVKKMANDSSFQKVTNSKGYQNIILPLKEKMTGGTPEVRSVKINLIDFWHLTFDLIDFLHFTFDLVDF